MSFKGILQLNLRFHHFLPCGRDLFLFFFWTIYGFVFCWTMKRALGFIAHGVKITEECFMSPFIEFMRIIQKMQKWRVDSLFFSRSVFISFFSSLLKFHLFSKEFAFFACAVRLYCTRWPKTVGQSVVWLLTAKETKWFASNETIYGFFQLNHSWLKFCIVQWICSCLRWQ